MRLRNRGDQRLFDLFNAVIKLNFLLGTNELILLSYERVSGEPAL